jgi:transposase-like protein
VNEEQHRSQSRRRRFYDEEFKRNAVELLEAGGARLALRVSGNGWKILTVIRYTRDRAAWVRGCQNVAVRFFWRERSKAQRPTEKGRRRKSAGTRSRI